MSDYQMTILKVAIHQADVNPVFHEYATWVEIEDEAGGPFVRISQSNGSGGQSIALGFDEIPMLFKAVDFLRDQDAIRKAEKDLSKPESWL